jgi:hypothetical protein
MSDYLKEEKKFFRNSVLWFIGVIFAISTISYIIHKSREVTKIDSAVLHYEEYQEIYNTCVKLNTDLCNIKQIPENDEMFKQFSKQQRVLAIKTQLNRWVEDYNAKSKMWGRSLWKSKNLPYQLSNEQFSCNN